MVLSAGQSRDNLKDGKKKANKERIFSPSSVLKSSLKKKFSKTFLTLFGSAPDSPTQV